MLGLLIIGRKDTQYFFTEEIFPLLISHYPLKNTRTLPFLTSANGINLRYFAHFSEMPNFLTTLF